MKILETEPAVDKEWDKLENLPSWDCQKGRPKAEVVRQATLTNELFLFFQMHAERARHLRLYKGGVVLTGDNIYGPQQKSSSTRRTKRVSFKHGSDKICWYTLLTSWKGQEQRMHEVSVHLQVRMSDAPRLLR